MADSKDTYHTVTPYLVVPDADVELAFLKTAFGGTEATCQRNPDNTVMHAEVRIGDSLVMLGQASEQWKPLTAALYLWVEDVDATYAKALRAGATSQSEPEDKPYGHRNAGVVGSERRDVVARRPGQVRIPVVSSPTCRHAPRASIH